MASGFYDFVAGAKPLATEWDDYISKQVVMVFASAATRDTALSGVLREGMVVYQTDINTTIVYTGSAWEIVSEPPQTWSFSTITQSVSVAVSTVNGYYRRSMGHFDAFVNVAINATGTANQTIVLPTPVTLSAAGNLWGDGNYFDSGNQFYKVSAAGASTTTLQLYQHSGTDTFGRSPNFAVASGDTLALRISGRY